MNPIQQEGRFIMKGEGPTVYTPCMSEVGEITFKRPGHKPHIDLSLSLAGEAVILGRTTPRYRPSLSTPKGQSLIQCFHPMHWSISILKL